MKDTSFVPPNFKPIAKRIQLAFEAPHLSEEDKAQLLPDLQAVLVGLENGTLQVVEKINDNWLTHVWIKQAILLYFRCTESQVFEGGFSLFMDKIPLRFDGIHPHEMAKYQTRIVPPASIRRGAYLGPRTIIMPAFINIGAYVGEGSLIDTWATVGSCAYIGKGVHLSGGAGIGGVLEPLQAKPTIIEDHCFIGARSEIVEGVVVGEGAVIGMGVFIGQSTKIYDRQTGKIHQGQVPPYSVVVAGSLPSSDGKYALNAAIIVKTVDEKTRAKTSLNELLRD